MKAKTYAALAAVILLLAACGDDDSQSVPAAVDIGSEYLPKDGIGGLQAGAGESVGVAGENPGTTGELQGAAGENPGTTGELQGAAGENPGTTGELQGAAEENSDTQERLCITISAAGDVTLGNYLGQEYSNSFRQTYEKVQDDAYFFENVADIFSADDMTLVNLEGPLTTATEGRTEQTFCISGDPAYASILTAGSVEAVSMANNHRLDYYEQGTTDTVEAVKGQNIVYAYDGNVGIYETKGIRIGYVSVNEVGQGAGVERYLQDGFEKLREEKADLIFACCHWGVEREFYPEEYQRTLGRKCIDWGADLVIGCHPHVLQGIEEYQGKYIVYSLGNFCFGANRNPKDKDCIIYQQSFFFENGEKQPETEVRVIPCSVSSVSDRNDYKPTPADGGEAERIIGRLNEYSKEFGVAFDSSGCLKDGANAESR